MTQKRYSTEIGSGGSNSGVTSANGAAATTTATGKARLNTKGYFPTTILDKGTPAAAISDTEVLGNGGHAAALDTNNEL